MSNQRHVCVLAVLHINNPEAYALPVCLQKANVPSKPPSEHTLSLRQEIDTKRQTIHTDDYPVSVFEISTMYQMDEVDIHPEFQRYYRWSASQKSSLIESILLGLPLPSIFVYQRQDGVLDVIDGIQRLSTIFEFLGILKDNNGALLPPLVLRPGKYLPSMNNMCWDPALLTAGGEQTEKISDQIKRFFRRSKLDIKLVLRESDESAKFELFRRLNTGGSLLSDQEMRNCLLVMLNNDFYSWVRSLADHEAFQETCSLTERLILEQYDVELVLRFILLHNIDEDKLTNIGDLGEFLTENSQQMALSEDIAYDTLRKRFESVFVLMDEALGDNALRKYDSRSQRFKGGFSVSAFEMTAMGLGYRLSAGGTLPSGDELIETVKTLWSDPRTDGIGGSGVRASTRIPKTIKIGREYFG